MGFPPAVGLRALLKLTLLAGRRQDGGSGYAACAHRGDRLVGAEQRERGGAENLRLLPEGGVLRVPLPGPEAGPGGVHRFRQVASEGSRPLAL